MTFPNGHCVDCNPGLLTHGQWMIKPLSMPTSVDIYWALLEPESPVCPYGVLSMFQMWKPWIDSLAPYQPPQDPLHRDHDDMYKEEFSKIEGDQWKIESSCIYVAEQGVAAACVLTSELLEWFKISATAVIHISLALGIQHEARELGPMVKRLLSITDWQNTDIT